MVYMLVLINLKNPQKLAEYSAAAKPTLAAVGAKLMAKGKAVTLTGDKVDLAALINFPDLKTAERWYASEEYQAVIGLRDEGADVTFVVIDN